MELVVDSDHLGTTELQWASSARLAALKELAITPPERVLVVAPHPDDEVFGAGGLLQALLGTLARVEFIAVTDGEASHPDARAEMGIDLRQVRAAESERALARLGCGSPSIARLGIPDGRVVDHAESLSDLLAGMLRPGDLCLAPWWHDGHPDHDASGAAALRAARTAGATFLGYLVWAWHWTSPERDEVPWELCRRFGFSRRVAARKRWATGAFRSQTTVLGAGAHEDPVLPAPLLRRFWRSYEVFVTDPGHVG
ncbi:MAG TPA: PIG-L family deacetylase [Acidimicrobiales bacterium]|jgi:LmbE family N-acetylglucosaminyl deacetylase|nr:PIG-L family deacetylase [Acidimicrobiales bacterium]